MIARWIIGMVIGTVVMMVLANYTMPTYVPRIARGPVWVWKPGADYRHVSEGYAVTHLGPLGMPGLGSDAGVKELESMWSGKQRIALWGDSQAEGLCVRDEDKVFAIAERFDTSNAYLPLARSGDGLVDWTSQFAWVEENLDIDRHVILLVELSDLTIGQPSGPPSAARQWIAEHVPSLFIHCARRMLQTPDGESRRLRWQVGPTNVSNNEKASPNTGPLDLDREFFDRAASMIRAATQLPVRIVYAPRVGIVLGGKLMLEDRQPRAYRRMANAMRRHGIEVVSVVDELAEIASEGQPPFGFEHGRIGSGHLNEHGNRIVAAAVAGL
ncbi:MAG: hypothetical protein AAF664_12605 [Planctomycetota bacterium]